MIDIKQAAKAYAATTLVQDKEAVAHDFEMGAIWERSRPISKEQRDRIAKALWLKYDTDSSQYIWEEEIGETIKAEYRDYADVLLSILGKDVEG